MQADGLAEADGDRDPVPGAITIFCVDVPKGQQDHGLD